MAAKGATPADAEKGCEAAPSTKSKIRSLPGKIVDKVLALVPDKVAEHLGNSKKELLRAVTSVIEDEIRRTDALVERTKKAKLK